MVNIPKNQITQLLQKINDGDAESLNRLLILVYNEIKKIASKYLAGEYSKRTIQTTELVHEAYLKLIGQKNLSLENRKHFFSAVANSMRQILVDNARKRNALKRGLGKTKISLDKAAIITSEKDEEILSLNEALIKLDSFDERLSRIVELRFFTGLTIEETAEILSISPTTVKRDWNVAKAWLYREIENNN
jgi:RNA polymerase sigma factor (TIGR02999 family)